MKTFGRPAEEVIHNEQIRRDVGSQYSFFAFAYDSSFYCGQALLQPTICVHLGDSNMVLGLLSIFSFFEDLSSFFPQNIKFISVFLHRRQDLGVGALGCMVRVFSPGICYRWGICLRAISASASCNYEPKIRAESET